jgi:hypothetical protein
MAIEFNSWISLAASHITTAASYITVALALPYVYRFSTFLIFSKSHKGVFNGTWYSYHYTRKGTEIIFKNMQFEFKKKFAE